AQRFAYPALDAAAFAIGGGLAGGGFCRDEAVPLDLVLLRPTGRQALAMRGAALDAVVERQGLAEQRPCGREGFPPARRVLATGELAGADLRFPLVLVEDALLLVALGDAHRLEVDMRLALVAQAAVASAVERADAGVGLGPLLRGGDIGRRQHRQRHA